MAIDDKMMPFGTIDDSSKTKEERIQAAYKKRNKACAKILEMLRNRINENKRSGRSGSGGSGT